MRERLVHYQEQLSTCYTIIMQYRYYVSTNANLSNLVPHFMYRNSWQESNIFLRAHSIGNNFLCDINNTKSDDQFILIIWTEFLPFTDCLQEQFKCVIVLDSTHQLVNGVRLLCRGKQVQ